MPELPRRFSCHLPCSPQIQSLPMLAPFASRLDLLTEQLGGCLEGLAAMVRRELEPNR